MNAETSYSITDAGMSPASTDGGLRFKQAPDVSALKSLPEDCEISGYKKILSIELLKGSIFCCLCQTCPVKRKSPSAIVYLKVDFLVFPSYRLCKFKTIFPT